MTAQYDSFVRLFEAMPFPVRILSADGRVVAETRSVVRLLAEDRESHRVRAAFEQLARVITADARPVADQHVHTAAADYRLHGVRVGASIAGYDSIVIGIDRVIQPMLTDASLRDRFGLTPREIDIARLLAAGLPNDEIATRLDRSGFTVRRHTERILAKLAVRRRAQVGIRLLGGEPAHHFVSR